MLNRTEGINILSHWKNDDSSRVLTCSTSNTCTALYYSVNFAFSLTSPDAVVVFFNKAVGCLISKRRYSSRSEGLTVTEDNLGVLVGLGLILSREVKVDIWLLVSLESKESLERNIKAILVHHGAALGASLIRHIAA